MTKRSKMFTEIHVLILVHLSLVHFCASQSSLTETYRPWSGNLTGYLTEPMELEINCAGKCSQMGVACFGYTYRENKNCLLIKSYSKFTTQDQFFIKGMYLYMYILAWIFKQI